jgi:sulfonate transport system ATP-binding protein
MAPGLSETLRFEMASRHAAAALAQPIPVIEEVAVPSAQPVPGPAVQSGGGGGLSLSIRGLRKAFGDNQVLRGVDLHVPAGQFVAIVGRSGCGKSTLLRLIAGLDAYDGGSLVFGGGSAGAQENAQETVRVMFQEPRLLPWARVLSNVEVGLGGARKERGAAERAAQALAEVGLSDKLAQWPATLSGGQKQRVALARALVSNPQVLAFDEPLGALDALTRITMQQLLERVWRDQGFTAILVTHDVAEAIALADRVIVLEEGRISLDLTVDLPRPRQRGSVEVAALEGTILKSLLG